jgi:polyribonucleotide nucleotidyltransferase
MRAAVAQAREGRMFIMGKMLEVIREPRKEMSPYAPRMYRLQIDPQKIGTVIGPGGRVIRSIIEETGCTVDIEDDGSVFIGATNEESARKAIDIIEGMTKDVEVGQIYTGRVARIMNFGAFVEIAPGKDGLVHISELADFRVPSVEDVVSVGDEVQVMVTEVDSMGRINLSRRAVLAGETDPAAVVARQQAERSSRPGGGDRGGDRGGRGGGGGYGGRGGGGDRGPRGGGGGGPRRSADGGRPPFRPQEGGGPPGPPRPPFGT